MAIAEVTDFIQQEKKKINKNNDSIDILKEQTSTDVVQKSVISEAVDNAVAKLKDSPLAQLGEDFLAEQIAKNGNQIMNNITKQVESTIETQLGISPRKTLAEAQSAVFNTIGAALTAEGDLCMFFLQRLANNILEELDKKDAILRELQEKIRELYNALVLLVAGDPFFSQYLDDLRRALILMDNSQTNLQLIKNTFDVADIFLSTKFEQVKQDLEAAADLIEPDDDDPDVKFTDSGLLAGVGIPSEPQQLTVLLSVPQLVGDVLQAADGYFISVFRINALLLAFITGEEKCSRSTSQKLKNYTLDTLESLITKLDTLNDKMAREINGSTEARQAPIPGFEPDPVGVSGRALGWLFELRTIIEYLSFVPGDSLEAVSTSQSALDKYNEAVEALKLLDGETRAGAVLTATDGREEVGQLEQQITTFVLAALQAIVDAEVADEILALGRTLLIRLDLSLELDQQIREAILPFAQADLGFTQALEKAGNSIYSLLDEFGLDRAKDLLERGGFEEFFNLNSKTATFAGAALVGIAVLKECLSTTEDRQQLDDAERVIQRENTSKDLLAERGAVIGFEQQKAQNEKVDRDLTKVNERACESAEKCGLPSDFQPTSLVKNLGPIIGVSLLGGGSVSDSLQKLGKGLF